MIINFRTKNFIVYIAFQAVTTFITGKTVYTTAVRIVSTPSAILKLDFVLTIVTLDSKESYATHVRIVVCCF